MFDNYLVLRQPVYLIIKCLLLQNVKLQSIADVLSLYVTVITSLMPFTGLNCIHKFYPINGCI